MNITTWSARLKPRDPEIPVTLVCHEGHAVGHVAELADGELRYAAVVYRPSGRPYFAAMAPSLAAAAEVVLMYVDARRPCA